MELKYEYLISKCALNRYKLPILGGQQKKCPLRLRLPK